MLLSLKPLCYKEGLARAHGLDVIVSLLTAEAQRNEPDAIQKLINDGMDPSVANGVGQTALHVACLWGTHKCVEVLIKAGAKVSGCFD